MLNWISEAERLPKVAQSVLLLTPRQAGEWWDISVARILIQHEGVTPMPVNAGAKWPTSYWWSRFHRDTCLVTGNAFWASLEHINLPLGAEHHFLNGFSNIKQVGNCFIPQADTKRPEADHADD